MDGIAGNSVGRFVVLSSGYLALQAAHLRPNEEWFSPRRGLVFLFPNSGSGELKSGAVSCALSAGNAAVISSEAGGRVRACPTTPLSFWYFSVALDELYPLFASHELYLLGAVEERLKQSKWCLAPAAVATECHKLLRGVPGQINLEHRGYLLRIAAAVLSGQLNDLRPGGSGYVPMEEHLCKVFEKISLDDLMNSSVGELTKKFSISRRHLNRLFHQYFGLPVAKLTMELRMLKAASLLRDPSVKVIHAAEQCGFNHLGLFGTRFKRRFGMSPVQWRKQVVEAAPQEPPAGILLKQIAGEIMGKCGNSWLGPQARQEAAGCDRRKPAAARGSRFISGAEQISPELLARAANPQTPGGWATAGL